MFSLGYRPLAWHGVAKRLPTGALNRVSGAEVHNYNKIAIVTGAARGIGAATAERLARDGNAVAVVDLDEAACQETVARIVGAGGRAVGLGADVGRTEAVAAAIARIADELGPPSILVNNAGITRDNLSFKMTDSDWDDVITVHLRGSFLMSREVQPFLTKARWGRIVNLSSVSALGNRGQANYSTAKAGLQGLTKTLAIELGRFNVTVNAIAPGFIVTDMTAATAERLGLTFEEFKERGAKSIPVGRVGEPNDIANLVSFLCGDESGFVSGQVIYVAGGPKA
jgi:3-oxoacyl-[acyl-carrier protein] reductase